MVCLAFSVLETLLQSVLIVSGSVRYYWTDRAICIFPPDFETLLKFLTTNSNIVIDGEKDLGCCLLGHLEPPVHGVIGSLEEVDGSDPFVFVLEDAHLLHRLLVVPDNVDLGDNGALHGGIAINVLHELRVISSSGVSDRDESKPR